MRPAVLSILATAAVAAPAPAAVAQPAEIAEGLRRDPVYVAPGAKPSLTPAEAGRVRLRIVRRDIGRIKVAVLPGRAAQEAGGMANLANAVDRELRAKGNLILVAGGNFHLITSYPQVGPALAALRAAVQPGSGRELDAQLLAAVDGLAEVDPGPAGDGPQPGPDGGGIRPPAAGNADDAANDVLGTFRLAVLIVAAAVALPFLLVCGWLLLRYRRGRADQAEALEEDRQAARDELITLNEEIRALDIDVSMPSAAAAGRDAYERALRHYELADGGLPKATTPRRLGKVRAALEQGRREIEAAKALLAARS